MKQKLISDHFSFTRSIIFRLSVIVALIVSIFGLIGIFIAENSAKKQLTRVIQKQQLAFAEYIAQHIDIEMEKSIYFISDLANELSVKSVETAGDYGTLSIDKGRVPHVFKHGVILISPNGKK